MFRLVFETHHGRALGADSGEKHEPASDVVTAVVDSLKALDFKRPIREADIAKPIWHGSFVPTAVIGGIVYRELILWRMPADTPLSWSKVATAFWGQTATCAR